MMRDQMFFKWIAIFWMATVMYWLRIPHPERALIMLMGLDLLVGVIGGVARSEFTARKLFFGICQKFVMLGLLLGVHVFEILVPMDVDIDVDKWVAFALCFYEFSSLLETYIKMGLKVPPVLKKLLDQVQKLVDSDAPAVAPQPQKDQQ